MSRVEDPTLRFLHQRIGRYVSRIERGAKLSEDEWEDLISCRRQVRRIEATFYPEETRLIGHSGA